MKNPLYALLVAPDDQMRLAIVRKDKKISIREGHRDYQIGPVMLCCHLEPWAVMADITNVRHCTLKEVTKKEYVADEVNNRQKLLELMKKFYPHMTIDSPVTVIRWDNARGKLVEYQDAEDKYFGIKS